MKSFYIIAALALVGVPAAYVLRKAIPDVLRYIRIRNM